MYFVVLFLNLVTQVFSIVCKVYYTGYTDGTYSYVAKPIHNIPTPSRDDMRNWVKATSEAMERDAAAFGAKVPGALALLFVFTGDNTGSLIMQSSIKRSPPDTGSILTQDLTNSCFDGRHRLYGNCAEMGAMAVALDNKLSLRGAVIAVYGTQGNSRTWVPACRNDQNGWGCGAYCSEKEVRLITKRSRIEGGTILDARENAVVERDPKPPPLKSITSKSPMSTSPASTSPTPKSSKLGTLSKHTFVVELN